MSGSMVQRWVVDRWDGHAKSKPSFLSSRARENSNPTVETVENSPRRDHVVTSSLSSPVWTLASGFPYGLEEWHERTGVEDKNRFPSKLTREKKHARKCYFDSEAQERRVTRVRSPAGRRDRFPGQVLWIPSPVLNESTRHHGVELYYQTCVYTSVERRHRRWLPWTCCAPSGLARRSPLYQGSSSWV